MTSENMMAELRRIVGAFVKQREAEMAEAAEAAEAGKKSIHSARAAQAAAIFEAHVLGRASGIGAVLIELSNAFGIGLSEFAAKGGAE